MIWGDDNYGDEGAIGAQKTEKRSLEPKMTAFSPLPWCALILMDSGSFTCVNDSAVMGVGTVHAFLDFYL